MAKAQDMVQLAEKFRETLASKVGEAETADVEMHRQLIEMGIASPVTKDTAGARYHQQLSRQVCPYMLEPLADSVTREILLHVQKRWIVPCSSALEIKCAVIDSDDSCKTAKQLFKGNVKDSQSWCRQACI